MQRTRGSRDPGPRGCAVPCPALRLHPNHRAFGQTERRVPTALPQGLGSPEGRKGVEWEGALSPFQGNYYGRNLEPHVFLRLPNK